MVLLLLSFPLASVYICFPLAKCLHIDTRDVFFQGNAFELMTDGLYILEEGVALVNEPHYNQKWIHGCGGSQVLNEMMATDAVVVNADVVGASNKLIFLEFLRALKSALSHLKCNDQGIFNILAYRQLPPKMSVHILNMTRDS